MRMEALLLACLIISHADGNTPIILSTVPTASSDWCKPNPYEPSPATETNRLQTAGTSVKTFFRRFLSHGDIDASGRCKTLSESGSLSDEPSTIRC